jgi:hypothetical protein
MFPRIAPARKPKFPGRDGRLPGSNPPEFDGLCARPVKSNPTGSNDYEHAVRLVVSLGGDADTLAYITGGVAHAHYGGVPTPTREQALGGLDDRLRGVVGEFESRFPG